MKINLKFTPIENYFFGKENKDKNGDDNYFLKSFHLPQPTTLLGAIRFWLLWATDNFKNGSIIDKNMASEDIGESSYKVNGTLNLGKIKQVSNLYLLDKNNQKYLPAPLWLDEAAKELSWNDSIKCPILPSYDPKNYYPNLYTNGQVELDSDSIFEERIDSHNRKNNKEDKSKDAYYKTQTYYLKENFGFGVTFEYDGNLKNATSSYVMKMGGENKLFKVEIIENTLSSDASILSNYANNSFFKLVLSSDSYFTNLNKNDYLFGIVNTKNFKSLFVELNKINNYNALDKERSSQNKYTVKSDLLQLIDAGSVFYLKKEEDAQHFIKQHLSNEKLSKAGFNHYILLNPKNN